MRIAFTTLGCKINQYETDTLRQDLQAQGNTIVPFDGEADVYIINTCSVTAKSDYQSRQVIRSAIKRGQGARVIVTGCYASTRPEEIKKIAGVELIVHNRDKAVLPGQIMKQSAVPVAVPLPSGNMRSGVSGRTRGFLKIQDGCNNRCSYCIVPLARGESRSAPVKNVVKEFQGMTDARCPEVVLTGIHIGTYGIDLSPATSLTDLIESLLALKGQTRIRLSSIEPNEVSDRILDFLGTGLCRHLHIPLQSGDDSILRTMKRNYSSGLYFDLLEKIAGQVPGIALGADVMVGFPGEGDKQFENTMNLVRKSPLTHIHVFSYSPRPGTPAASFKNQIPEPVKKERNEALRNVGAEKNLQFRKKHLGLQMKVGVEDNQNPETGLFSGLTDNYIRVSFPDVKKENIGREISIMIDSVTDRETVGKFL
jgi:threonylcarbamoyladenosine tRNA methylthiotransferase MtaB